MRINELLAEQQNLDEGIGSVLGGAAGHVAGATGAAGRGLSSAWKDAKQGYADAKAKWGQTPAAPGATPAVASGTPTAAPTTAPAATPNATGTSGGIGRPYVNTGTAPAAISKVGSIMQSINKLDPASKKQLAGALAKSMSGTPAAPPAATSTPPAATPAAAAPAVPQATTPVADPAHTGGKVPGQVSQTPNAIRKRDARSIAADRARLIPDNGGANEGRVFHSNFLGIDL